MYFFNIFIRFSIADRPPVGFHTFIINIDRSYCIDAILRRAHQLQPAAKLVLVGMKIPPNYGRAYSQQFESIYPQLARAHGATLVPFLLEGVGGISALNQADGVHPTAEGQRRMAETVWRVLEPVLKDTAKTDATEKASG